MRHRKEEPHTKMWGKIKLKDRITPHMNLYESEGSKAQSSQRLNSFYNTALSGSDISFRQQRGGREGVRE